MSEPTAPEALEATFRSEYPRVVGSLMRRFGDLQLAEDAMSEAVVEAMRTWPERGVPPNPGGWLTTTATRRALDHLRRESTRDARESAALDLDTPAEPIGAIDDDRLRLMFLCAHPLLAWEQRVALTLRLVGGLPMAEVGAAFLVPERTMAQRLTRAKRTLREAGVTMEVPYAADVPVRLGGVRDTLYLLFTRGARDEAIRLARLLCELVPDDLESRGLLALLLLAKARSASASEEFEPVSEQDRSGWDRVLIAEGDALVRSCLAAGRPGQLQVQAAISAVHCSAPTYADTDWGQVLELYDLLQSLADQPVIALNRAVALAEVHGPEVALPVVEDLGLEHYQPWHAVRADLLARVGRSADAAAAYREAADRADDAALAAWLLGKAVEVS
ncbi:RNA polymerase sigma factor [Actinomycetota bacterium]